MSNIHTKRLRWVDAAKGLLILLMAIGHMNQRSWELGVSSPVIDYFRYGELVWSVFFMATFFILSGFWGKYELSFKDYVIKNAKALLLPLIVFSFCGGILHELIYEVLKKTYNESALIGPSLEISIAYWFVLSLFVAKCVLWCIFKLVKSEMIRWVFIVLTYFVGVLLLKARYLPNYVYWKWGLVLMMYLPLGQVVKKYIQSWGLFFVSLVSFVGVWIAFYHFDLGMPLTTYRMTNLDLCRAVPSLIMCFSGSFVFLKLCSFIKSARVLELLGRNTLAIYVMHWWIEILAIKVMRSLFSQGIGMSVLATLLCVALAVFVPCLISEWLNHSKIKWVVGK